MTEETQDSAPQHLLGGLNVAILAWPGCRPEHVMATKASLEEQGVNVQILSTAKGPVPRAGAIDAVQAIATADPDGFDAVVLPGGAEAADRLRGDQDALSFIRRLDDEEKPVAALGESVAVLAATAKDAAHTLTADDDDELDAFQQKLRVLLADRRRKRFATVADDVPSAVGEDG
jgi:protease I